MKRSECENVAKIHVYLSRWKKKIEVIRRKEDGQTRPNVCRIMELPLSTVRAIMESAYRIKQYMLHARIISVT